LLLNQRGLDWRWGREGEACRWYSRHRIFRRGLDERWSAVVGRVKAELRLASETRLEEAA
jgi:hypothetical protein